MNREIALIFFWRFFEHLVWPGIADRFFNRVVFPVLHTNHEGVQLDCLMETSQCLMDVGIPERAVSAFVGFPFGKLVRGDPLKKLFDCVA